jgi:hypothetical protein
LAVGILVGLFTVFIANGGTLLIPAHTSPGYVLLDGIKVDIFYQNGTPPVFGPNEQQLCKNCPMNLTGGTTFMMSSILSLLFPPNSTTTFYFNASSPVPFEEWECSWSGARPAGWPPTGCPFVEQWNEPRFSVYDGAGQFMITYPLTLSIPDPAPSLPGGFEVQIVMWVSMVPGVTTPPFTAGTGVA